MKQAGFWGQVGIRTGDKQRLFPSQSSPLGFPPVIHSLYSVIVGRFLRLFRCLSRKSAGFSCRRVLELDKGGPFSKEGRSSIEAGLIKEGIRHSLALYAGTAFHAVAHGRFDCSGVCQSRNPSTDKIQLDAVQCLSKLETSLPVAAP